MAGAPPSDLDRASKEAVQLLEGLGSAELDHFAIVGNYLRFDPKTRSALKDFRQKVTASFEAKGTEPRNFLIWGAPGSGKSYLVQQVAAHLPASVSYRELNLAVLDESGLRTALDEAMALPGPVICLIDEVDSKPTATWPYELMLPYLEPPKPREHRATFCLAGSGGGSVDGLKDKIRARPKGPDLLSRVASGNEFTVPSLSVGDRMLVSITQLLLSAGAEQHPIREIEKLALFYIAVNPTLSSARQLRSLAAQAAQRIAIGDDRLRYDNLFAPGDPENKRFWGEAAGVHEHLAGVFVHIDPGTIAAPTPKPAAAPMSHPPPLHPRLAILPLRNISPDPSDEYFADGLTDELTTALGRVQEIRVLSQTSVAQFQKQDRAIPDFGRELGASAVLEGSVRKSGERLRITLQLVDVSTQEGLWSQTFDRRMGDVFDLQAEIGERTVEALRVRMLGTARAALHKTPTSNLSAYGLYLQGLHRLHATNVEDRSRAIELFRTAIEEDPKFSDAYSQLANCLLAAIGDSRPAREVIPEVRPLIEKALALDPESSEAHTAKGNLAMQGDLDWGTAETEFRRAISLNPSNSSPRAWYGLLLRALQRYADAQEQFRVVMELDPLNVGGPAALASALRLAGQVEESKQITRTKLQPLLTDAGVHMTLAYTHFYEGDDADARRELSLDKDLESLDRAVLLARLGDPTGARSLLEKTERAASQHYVAFVSLAALASAAGETERAIDYLEKDWTEGDRGLWFVYQGLGFDPIRMDPRFVRLLERMRLPTSTPFYRDGRIR